MVTHEQPKALEDKAWVKKGGHYLRSYIIFQHKGAYVQENKADKTPDFGAPIAAISDIILKIFSTKKMFLISQGFYH